MNLAFCLFRYFPHGGLQRDFFRIAMECLQRGHRVSVFAGAWEGPALAGSDLTLLKSRGLTNHARCRNFSRDLQPYLMRGRFDAVIGFNKMAGLDIYYAADTCFKARADARRNGMLAGLNPRYQVFCELENQVFARSSRTEIMMISPLEQARFQDCYKTQDERFHLLPPGISRDRVAPPDAAEIRAAVRHELGLSNGERLLVMVGSAFRTKGLDRAIRALAALPDDVGKAVRLLVIGRGKAAEFTRLAQGLGVVDRVQLLGARDDVSRFLQAADLLVHPARTENTGTVLLEALASGLPVLASAVCGYGHHVLDASAGELVPEPFSQRQFNEQLSKMLAEEDFTVLRRNAVDYVARTDIFSLIDQAADLIERVGSRRSDA